MIRGRGQVVALSLAAALGAALTGARLVEAMFPSGLPPSAFHPSWFAEQVLPMGQELVAGEPIRAIDQRQYGPVALLAIEPILRTVGFGPLLNIYVALLGFVAAGASYWLVVPRLFTDPRARLLIGLLWFSAAPLLISLRARSIDVWQLFFVAAGLFLFARDRGPSSYSAVPIVAGALTKLLPGFLLVYIFLRAPRIGLLGGFAALLILAAGHVAFGPLLGFSYPLAIAGSLASGAARFSLQWENNSLVGVAQKVASGFRVEPAPTGLNSGYLMTSDMTELATAMARIVAVAAAAYFFWTVVVRRRPASWERRSFEFCFATMTMLLISPQTSHEYMVMALPPLVLLLYLWHSGLPRKWPRPLVISAVASGVLISVFVPVSPAVSLLQLDRLWVATGNGDLGATAPIGIYQHFGLPGLGLVLGWVTFAVLDRLWDE